MDLYPALYLIKDKGNWICHISEMENICKS